MGGHDGEVPQGGAETHHSALDGEGGFDVEEEEAVDAGEVGGCWWCRHFFVLFFLLSR